MGADFDREDDDWMPMLFLEGPDGEQVVAQVDTAFFEGEPQKDALANQVIPKLIREHGARKVGLLTSAWMSHQAPGSPPPGSSGYVRPSEAPDRQEVVVIWAVDADGNTVSMGRIERHDDAAPTLGEFDLRDDEVEGRFIEPAQAALREADGD